MYAQSAIPGNPSSLAHRSQEDLGKLNVEDLVHVPVRDLHVHTLVLGKQSGIQRPIRSVGDGALDVGRHARRGIADVRVLPLQGVAWECTPEHHRTRWQRVGVGEAGGDVVPPC